MTVPLINATVTSIAGGGTSENYDTPAGSDTEKLSASKDAYLDETLVDVTGGGTDNQIRRSFVVVDYDVGKLAAVDDTVTVIFEGNTQVRKVRDIELFKLFGSARVWFREE